MDMPVSRQGSLLEIAGATAADASGSNHDSIARTPAARGRAADAGGTSAPNASGTGTDSLAPNVLAGARWSVDRRGGHVFTDLLLLASLACQAPVSLVSVRQADGSWTTLAHGLEGREGLNDSQLYEVLAAVSEPVEITDMVSSVPRSPLVLPPHSMRWAYGVALRDEQGTVIGAVAVLDRWLRQIGKREQRAMAAMSRQMAAHLAQWRRSSPVTSQAVAEPAPAPAAAPAVEPAPLASPVVASVAGDRHPLLRSQEVAEIFDVTERTVINWAAAGKLPCLRTIGGHLRFRREEVFRLLSGDGA
jgi:excisionase family DNA binding protein